MTHPMNSLRRHIAYFLSTLFLGVASLSAQQAVSQPDDRKIEAIEAGPSVRVEGTTIEFSGDNSQSTKFEVFSITGQLVRTLVVPADRVARVELPRGCYIIKCAGWTKRVMLK